MGKGFSNATPVVYCIGFFAPDGGYGVLVVRHMSRGADRYLLVGAVEDDGEWFEQGTFHMSPRYVDEFTDCLNAARNWVEAQTKLELAAESDFNGPDIGASPLSKQVQHESEWERRWNSRS